MYYGFIYAIVVSMYHINSTYMFGYKYIVSVVLLLSSLLSLNAAFAEESQSTTIIPKIETYMWNDTLVVSLQ